MSSDSEGLGLTNSTYEPRCQPLIVTNPTAAPAAVLRLCQYSIAVESPKKDPHHLRIGGTPRVLLILPEGSHAEGLFTEPPEPKKEKRGHRDL